MELLAFDRGSQEGHAAHNGVPLSEATMVVWVLARGEKICSVVCATSERSGS